MALTDRILPPAEWSKLAPFELSKAVPHLNPELTQIAVVEDDGQIVACWMAALVLHAEGVEIHPAYRGRSSVQRKLWRRMKAIAAFYGRTSVVTGANSPEIVSLLTRQRAQPVPYQEFVLCL